ncbi:protein NYNRIN [Elysia marginata]|uniref:Protein NYNRIN n=1 Tax=Elysia marginata TaxID=1093978 RepID=A0AAV4EFQ3_9GAST|nr:protein NYNRIN [Elysia marginata]
MQAILKVGVRVSCIPNNTEKYISFSLGQLRFIDSAQFLLAPLAGLVAASSQPEAFEITVQYELDHQKRQLLLRKDVYPYEYMDSWERFEETALPPKEAFHSKLAIEQIDDSDYAHAQQVWKTFECRTLGDYTDFYCRTDVLLLADVFESFRKTCQKQYGLDPAHYYTNPGLFWDALLKKTGVVLELLTDYDQYHFIEKGMRGGISMVPKRHAKANNPAIKGYDPEKPNSSILYLDANNLYGWAMSQPLPTGGFRWVEDCNQLAGTITDLPADGVEGYILEVDLEYPSELHKAQNAYSLAPERMVVQKEWMSEDQHDLLKRTKKKKEKKNGLLSAGVALTEVIKLVPNPRDKDRYVLHCRNLQLYLSLGMKLKKINRALRFKQSPRMELYIRMNTELRKAATSGFEKDLYKLMNNSVFGKTMENLRKRIDVKLVRSHEGDKLRRLITSPSFARANVFDDDLAAVQMHKSRLVLDRPVYVGMSVLDLSKSLMYDFYYKQMKAQYGHRVELLYTDTDSLLLYIQTEDVYRDMGQPAGLYDTSDYPEKHPLHSKVNKKVLGAHPAAAGCLRAPGAAPRERIHELAHLRGNRAQAGRALSLIDRAGKPEGTTQGQWRDAAHPRVRRAGTSAGRQPLKEAFAPGGRQGGRGQPRRAFARPSSP